MVVAKFYREIMQWGLIQKIRGLNFEECVDTDCVKNTKMFIIQESFANQKLIKDIIRFDQAKLSKKLIRDIGEINDHIACTMKDDPKVIENPARDEDGLSGFDSFGEFEDHSENLPEEDEDGLDDELYMFG